MSSLSEEFLAWSLDPARTLEERFGILRFCEEVVARYYSGPDKKPPNYEADSLRRQDRRYNAAYDPVLKENVLCRVAELLPRVSSLGFHSYWQDRVIKDLSVLRFAPGTTELAVDEIDMESLDFLRPLTALKSLGLSQCDRVEDFTALAACRELRTFRLYSNHPWPDFRGIETLPHLESFSAHMDLRAFIEIPALPALQFLQLQSISGYGIGGSLRDFHQLPEMPLLQTLHLHSLYRLDGIERFPRLRAAMIWGFFRHLRPLARASALTHLRLTNDELLDVSAAATAPVLHHFALKSIRPQDWTTLMDAPVLREVYADGCEAPQPDLDTLRLVLPPRSDLFAAAQPRPLLPLRLRAHDDKNKIPEWRPPDTQIPEQGPGSWNGCQFMRHSESMWFSDELKESLRRAGLADMPGLRLGFGSRKYELPSLFSSPPIVSARSVTLRLLRVEAISRVREVVQAIRTLLCLTLHPWSVTLILNAEPDADEWDDDWRDSDDTPQERAMEHIREEDERKREKERLRLFLADQHRLALLKEQGTTEIPDDIGPRRLGPAKPLPPIFQPPAPPAKAPDDDDDDENDFFTDDGGGIA
ncbi:MAG: hypothetical protein JNG86_17105, partial [Verrucomicrobiaceae bacterium]|nr:hypothetical protein [Verrucomicrobiaceae bacterium]